LPTNYLPAQRRSVARSILYSILTIIAACMLVSVVLVLITSVGFDWAALGIAIVAAVLPTVAYGALVVWLDRNEPESWELRGLAFFWGAVVAVFIALFFNTTAFSALTLATNEDTSAILTAVIAAPLVEESAKGLLVLVVLIATRKHIDGLLDGMLLGALVGLGFAMTENVLYFGQAYWDGSASSVGSLFVVRSLINGMGHAVWTSFTGAAIGWARSRHGRGVMRAIVPLVGWSAAVLGHAIWNLCAALAIGILWIGFQQLYLLHDWQALVMAGIIGGLPFSIPPLLLAFILMMLGREQEERVVHDYLPIEIALGTITYAEYLNVVDPARRKSELRHMKAVGGKSGRRQQVQFNKAATRLAFFHYHAIKGERPYVPEIRQAEHQRWQLSALRWAMLNNTALR
jgi:RsiW-degrading membrane proteinase PrsW (M82 family)